MAAAAALRGVNLGGWLVLEQWMTPSLFSGQEATDEYGLCWSAKAAVNAGVEERIRVHRESFITRADFAWLAAEGYQAVRLPVGYWVFGDEQPYYGTIEYVDRAFEWAAETGLRILIDMHGAPGSQNGLDHSGREGACDWHTDQQNGIKTLQVVARLAERYAGRPELLGIELLNEPKPSIPRHILLRYYRAACALIRDKYGADIWIVFHDNFRPRRWRRRLRGDKYSNVYIDTHQYQLYTDRDKRRDITGHVHYTLGRIRRSLARMARSHPVIVGEWSLALDSQSLRGLSADEQMAAYRAYGAAQLIAYGQAAAWFYWSYKTEQGGPWSLRSATEQGLMPSFDAQRPAATAPN